jgi:hypothetical protein
MQHNPSWLYIVSVFQLIPCFFLPYFSPRSSMQPSVSCLSLPSNASKCHTHSLVSQCLTTLNLNEPYASVVYFRFYKIQKNACYRAVQNLLSSRLLSKNINTKIYKTVISPTVLHACETWSLMLRKGQRKRVLEKRVLRGIFGPKWMK